MPLYSKKRKRSPVKGIKKYEVFTYRRPRTISDFTILTAYFLMTNMKRAALSSTEASNL